MFAPNTHNSDLTGVPLVPRDATIPLKLTAKRQGEKGANCNPLVLIELANMR